MDQQAARVRASYDREPEREWDRLTSGAQNRLEFLITRHALRRHLPSLDHPRQVLDAGGGPGRYALHLAGSGYRVTLLDLSPGLLELARRHVHAADPTVQKNVADIVEGSVTDLSRFPNETFDAVLCLGGVLSHLTDRDTQRRALRELARVGHRNAPLFVTAFSRIALFRSVVQWPGWFDDVFPRATQSPVYQMGDDALPVYLFWPEEFTTLLDESDLCLDRLYGTSGIGAHVQEENLLALMDDPERWPKWRTVLLDTCDHPSVVGVSRSLLAVARRT
jgi:ubiquinone/menaquinone biosynthesis C-methylase UbiE